MSLDEVVAFARSPNAPDVRLLSLTGNRSAATTYSPLTAREREVTVLIARGFHNRDIAVALTITPRTVDTHVMNVLTKLELHTRAQIAVWAVEHGLTTKNT
jgi:DNA-binding NarL/FixJ family response regulator